MSDKYMSSQPDKRRPQRFTDQHGRKWSGTIEIASGMPTGPVTPLDFEPPLEVPQEFLKYDPMEPNFVKIDYAEWIASLTRAKAKWEQKLIIRARTLYGEQAGKYIQKPSPELLDMTGPEPSPVEPVQAAAAGNRYVLGLTPLKPKWATKFFPDKPKAMARPSRATAPVTDAVVEEWRDQFPDEDE